jgi:hypothetical protein
MLCPKNANPPGLSAGIRLATSRTRRRGSVVERWLGWLPWPGRLKVTNSMPGGSRGAHGRKNAGPVPAGGKQKRRSAASRWLVMVMSAGCVLGTLSGWPACLAVTGNLPYWLFRGGCAGRGRSGRACW